MPARLVEVPQHSLHHWGLVAAEPRKAGPSALSAASMYGKLLILIGGDEALDGPGRGHLGQRRQLCDGRIERQSGCTTTLAVFSGTCLPSLNRDASAGDALVLQREWIEIKLQPR